MSYLDHLSENLEKAEKLLAELEECLEKGYDTAADIVMNSLKGVLKVSLFCCGCAERKAEKLGIPVEEFKCVGGCVRGMSFGQWRENNKRLWYVFNLTRLWDKRYNKDKFVGNDKSFWEDENNEDIRS